MNTTRERGRNTAGVRGAIRRRVAMVTVAAAVIAVPFAGVASQPASASVRYAAVGNGLALRAGPGTQYPIKRKVNNGTPVDIVCQVQGGTNVGGNATWDKLVGGEWVADYFTTTPSFNSYAPGLGDCNAPIGPSALTKNQPLGPGQALVSPNHRFWMVMQGDGNLVVYDGFGWRWSSATNLKGGHHATIGWDGNFVVANSSGATVWETRTRWAGTEGNGTLYMQDDGNVVIYDALWEWTWQTASNAGRRTDTTGITRTPANNGLQVVLQSNVSGTGYLCGYNQYGNSVCSPSRVLGGYQTPFPGYWWKGNVTLNRSSANGQVFTVTPCYIPRYSAGSYWPGPPPLSNVVFCNS